MIRLASEFNLFNLFRYIRTMRSIIFILSIFLGTTFSYGQKEVKFKKKYYGNYKGTIPSYVIDTEEEIITVAESSIYVKIDEDNVSITVGGREIKGTYEVMFKAKEYYLLLVDMPDQEATERIMVYKHGKKIARDGLHPQPVAELEKY